MSEKKLMIPVVSALVAFSFFALVLYHLPKIQTDYEITEGKKTITLYQKIELENKARATLAQIFGGLFILAGLALAWRRVSVAENTLKTEREGQVTERFTRAMDQLGNESLAIRLGGIFALERIARDYEDYHQQIMEVLTAYIREHLPWPPKTKPIVQTDPTEPQHTLQKIPEDLQVIMTVIGRRKEREEMFELDLSHIDLRNFDLREANLKKAYLYKTNLAGADLGETRLERADLGETRLEGTFLSAAHLKGACLGGAHLNGADLYGTNLEKAIDLTQEQINSAKGDEGAKLPPSLVRPEHWIGWVWKKNKDLEPED